MKILIALSLLGLLGCDALVKSDLADIEKQVAQDSVASYNLSVKGGDKMEICTQASMVSASFLQAKDEKNYLKWKDIEKNDCANAGLPK